MGGANCKFLCDFDQNLPKSHQNQLKSIFMVIRIEIAGIFVNFGPNYLGKNHRRSILRFAFEVGGGSTRFE